MDTIALYTRLHPGQEEAYEEFHRLVPDAIVEDLCARGVHEWRIWRRGLDLFHLVIAEDYELFVNTPVTNEVAAGWGALMSEFLALNNDFGASNRMTQVWALKDQLMRPLERE
jgi:L-rhamnose mutarotase